MPVFIIRVKKTLRTLHTIVTYMFRQLQIPRNDVQKWPKHVADLYPPSIKLTKSQKETYYSGIKIF
jgi:hypothetical protein